MKNLYLFKIGFFALIGLYSVIGRIEAATLTLKEANGSGSYCKLFDTGVGSCDSNTLKECKEHIESDEACVPNKIGSKGTTPSKKSEVSFSNNANKSSDKELGECQSELAKERMSLSKMNEALSKGGTREDFIAVAQIRANINGIEDHCKELSDNIKKKSGTYKKPGKEYTGVKDNCDEQPAFEIVQKIDSHTYEITWASGPGNFLLKTKKATFETTGNIVGFGIRRSGVKKVKLKNGFDSEYIVFEECMIDRSFDEKFVPQGYARPHFSK